MTAPLTVQALGFPGLNYTSQAASVADSFVNDGRTFLLFTNAAVTARTLTIAADPTSRPGFGTIATPPTVVTIPGSGTNGGLCAVGPFPKERFNDGFGNMNYTVDVATSLTVAAISLTKYL